MTNQAPRQERVLTIEESALRHVALLVARGAPTKDVFEAAAEQVAFLFGRPWVGVMQYDSADSFVVRATWGPYPFPPDSRWPLDGPSTLEAVLRTGRPSAFSDSTDPPGTVAEPARQAGIVGGFAAPIVVDGVIWGAIAVPATPADPVPEGAEARLAVFTELVATAVSNTQAREAVQAAAEEQGALRRVATLVANGGPPAEVFAAVTREIALVLGANASLLARADPDLSGAVIVGAWSDDNPGPTGTWLPRGGTNVTTIVLETGRPGRLDDYDREATGEAARVGHDQGVRSSVGAPILVEGRLWGLVIVGATGDEPLPRDAENRLVAFTELVATAIANAEAHAELVASRARIVAAGDEARRRIERDLHDGTQQRLIAVGLDLQGVRAAIPDEQRDTHDALVRAEQDIEAILEDLRELSHGLHPPLLSRLGLGPSLQALARRSPIPLHLDVDLSERPAEPLETALYHVVSEAVTNAIKHSQASDISVAIASDGKLRASIVDDGVGGADPGGGSGLTGLRDRVDALGGHLVLESPPHGGTRISVELPAHPS